MWTVNSYDYVSSYKKILLEDFSRCMPLIVGDSQVIFSPNNSRQDDYISTILDELNIGYMGIDSLSYNETDLVLGRLYDDLYKYVDDEFSLLFGIMSCLEFNRYLAHSIIYNTDLNKSETDEYDDFVKLIAKSLRNNLNYHKLANTNHENVMYAAIENVVSLDRLSLENIIALLAKRVESKSFPIKNNFRFNDIKFEKVVIIGRCIENLKNKKIRYQIDDYNLLLSSTDYLQTMNRMKGREESFSDYLEDFDCILYEELGFKLSTIQKILDNFLKVTDIGTSFYISDYSNAVIFFTELSEGDHVEEIKNILDYFTYKTMENLYLISIPENKRFLKKPFLKFGDKLITINNLIFYAFFYFTSDVFSGISLSNKVDKKLQKIYKKIDDDFEIRVKHTIQQLVLSQFPYHDYILEAKVDQSNLFQDIKNDTFPGEIDVLLILGSKIFVIECKNYPLQVNPKKGANEINRLYKENNKSIQSKLDSKVRWMNDNLESVSDYYGVNRKDIKEVNGIVCTSNLSLASNYKTKYPIVSLVNLSEFIIKSI